MKSAATITQLPPDEGYEVAFAGRSNAGKSSAINRLCEQNSLARTSKTPGRTQMLNFFLLDDSRRIVDLPGYGYAKVAARKRHNWLDTLAQYLEHRRCLRGLILVADARHPLKEYDQQLLTWAAAANLPLHVLLSKADKLSTSAAKAAMSRLDGLLQDWHAGFSGQLFSALKGQGLHEVYVVLDNWLAKSRDPRN